MSKNVDVKFRSTINPVAIGITVVLYLILVILIVTTNPKFAPYSSALVIILVAIDIIKYSSYKYYFDKKGLTIVHKRKKYLLLYKDIISLEINSHETHGIIYGYGLRRMLISTGSSIENKFLITPAKEKEFIELLEKQVKHAKKNTR